MLRPAGTNPRFAKCFSCDRWVRPGRYCPPRHKDAVDLVKGGLKIGWMMMMTWQDMGLACIAGRVIYR
jgi:hypothetical protein